MKKYKTILIIITCTIFILCSCSANNSQQAEGEPTQSAKVSATQTVKKRGGELFIAMPTNIDSFNPYIARNEDLINLLSLIYETPIATEVDGKFKGNLFNAWTIDEEKKVFTFTLKDNIVFSDGTPLSANDILYSVRQVRALDNSNFFVGNEDELATYEPTTQESQTPVETDAQETETEENPDENAEDEEQTTIEEDEYLNRYAQYNSIVQSVEKIDDKTIRLTMSESGDGGLHFMMFPVQNASLAEQRLPVGTGPYKVDTYENNKMFLSVNENWWKEAPYITSIVANGIDKNADKLKSVDTSIIDFTTTDVLYASKYKIQDKIQVIDYMTDYYDCIIPNMSNAALQNVDVRRALSCAINRRELISTVLLNHGTSASVPIPPDHYSYETKYKFYEYDINYAKELLEKSGFSTSKTDQGNMLSLNMILIDDYNSAYVKEAAKAIKKQLSDVNVELNIEELSKTDYISRLNSGNFDLAFTSFFLDNNHNLSAMFSPDGKYNYGGYSSSDVQQAIVDCDGAIEVEEVKSTYGKLQELLVTDIPQIGLYFKMNSIVCDNTIQDIKNPRQNNVFSTISQWNINL